MDFFQLHAQRLEEFAALSQKIGARADYVQGGGGNTSVKLAGGDMAIKASGFRLCDIRPNAGYAVLDGAALRAFYLAHEARDFNDAEKECAAFTKTRVREVEGLAVLRPSVEAGFHSLLGSFVIHSHSVYANLAACALECEAILEQAFCDADFAYVSIPYVDPGARLTFAMRDALAEVEAAAGRRPAVVVMQNHGLVVHANGPKEALALHEEANARIAALFHLSANSFPEVRIERTGDNAFVSATPYLRDLLRGESYSDAKLLLEPLYPDQLVFFTGALGGTAMIDRASGIVTYRMGEGAARAFEETLACVLFIEEHIRAAGFTVRAMGEAAKAFIANWESEAYRKKLAEGKAP